MENQKNDFLNGPILSPLLRFAGPVLLALFLQAMYGAVDLIVVGKFAGTADISAVSTGSQAMHLVTSLLVGLTTGVTVLLGQKIGKGRPDEAGSVVGSAICLFVCVALALTALLSALTEPFCRLLQAPEEAFDPTTQYVRICSAGTLFIVTFNVIGSVFRGLGDSKCRSSRSPSRASRTSSAICCWWTYSRWAQSARRSQRCSHRRSA